MTFSFQDPQRGASTDKKKKSDEKQFFRIKMKHGMRVCGTVAGEGRERMERFICFLFELYEFKHKLISKSDGVERIRAADPNRQGNSTHCGQADACAVFTSSMPGRKLLSNVRNERRPLLSGGLPK